MNRFFFCVAFVLIVKLGSAQVAPNFRTISVPLGSDTITLDSMSLVPGSEIVKIDNQIIPDSSYFIDASKSLFYYPNGSGSTLEISFRVLPLDLDKEYAHKDISLVQNEQKSILNPFIYSPEQQAEELFDFGGLNKSGSISRGINAGNNQDLTVNSNLNLQLSGYLTDDIQVIAAVTDENIPIQPEGNTQQLQDFDQIYIKVFNDKSSLTAGDFVLPTPNTYFMTFNKKLQGGSVESVLHESDVEKVDGKLSAAISRGKFARNQIIGIEGNQGPYRMRGNDNEAFIIILSGTERVYIDGRLMKRGRDFDYVIDYNLAEITFTSRQIITKDKRIIVEFQYSERNYIRTLVHAQTGYERKNLQLQFNYYNEEDNKNQPLDIDLTNDQKQLMSDIGDSLNLAIIPNISVDSSADVTSSVFYKVVYDTANIPGVDSFFVYSTNPDSAIYRVGFSFVGEFNGNYVPLASDANGKVYGFVPPDPFTGTPQGSYEPVTVLITPKQRQMLTMGGKYELNENTKIRFEGASTKNDVNTFSNLDRDDDDGYGFTMGIDNQIPLNNRSRIVSMVEYEYIDKNFSPIERYRAVEFERYWNTAILNIPTNVEQHIVSAGTGIENDKLGGIHYTFSNYTRGTFYDGIKNRVYGNARIEKFHFTGDASVLNTTGVQKSSFVNHKANLYRDLGFVTLGLREEKEKSSVFVQSTDSLQSSSFDFQVWEAYATNSDTNANFFRLSYLHRVDLKPATDQLNFNNATEAEEFNAQYEFLNYQNFQLKTRATYREMRIKDTTHISLEPEENLLGRVDVNVRFIKRVFNFQSYYEIGSGLELRKDIIYVVDEINGTHIWNDYNNDSIQQVNEFEVAVFPERGTHIKVFVPTEEFTKVFTTAFNQVLFIKPEHVWANAKGFKKIAGKFSDKLAYRVNRKSADRENAFNPFTGDVEDTSLVSINTAFQNTIYFNRLGTVFGIDFSYEQNQNKTLLTNGFESRDFQSYGVRTRWNITRKFMLTFGGKLGEKLSRSEFFTTNNYNIDFEELEPKLSYQPGISFRSSVYFRSNVQRNAPEFGIEKSTNQSVGTELRYSLPKRGNLQANFELSEIRFDGDANSPIGYEMLNGLQPGTNLTWTALYQRNIGKHMQLSLSYSGRNSEGVRTLHNGSAQVRAFF